MAVMEPGENVYISTQIENITEFVFVCSCVCLLQARVHPFSGIHSLLACLRMIKFKVRCLVR